MTLDEFIQLPPQEIIKGLDSYQQDIINVILDRTKVAIIGEIWKSRAKLLRNRLFEKIASVTG